jgi:hypothetical protein
VSGDASRGLEGGMFGGDIFARYERREGSQTSVTASAYIWRPLYVSGEGHVVRSSRFGAAVIVPRNFEMTKMHVDSITFSPRTNTPSHHPHYASYPGKFTSLN